MVRTYFTALVALLALVSANVVFAFGLGEITLKSYLNQPFKAEIEILDKGDLTESEIIPKLATPKDFANVGLKRNFFLTRLNFKVIFTEERDYVLITSREPVNEPYLDFLVEFLWPEGRLLREYTVLLDPPSYAAKYVQPKQAVVKKSDTAQSQPAGQQTGQNESTGAEATQVSEAAGESQDAASEPQPEATAEPAQRKTVRNQPGETFWSIATRERPSDDVSVQQTMLAIQKLNPDAFENNNINYLKKNQVLRMPNEQEIRALASREAMGIVADQNREWAGKTLSEGKSLPVDTAKLVGSRQVTPMGDKDRSGDQMKLVAESGAEGEAAGSYSGEGSAASADELARATRQSQQLLEEKARLESQVETSERLLSLKDQQIAELQARLEEQGANTSTTVDGEVDNVIERVAVEGDSNASGEGEARVEEQSAETADEEEIEAALNQAEADAQALADEDEDMSFEADQEAAQQLQEDDSAEDDRAALDTSTTGSSTQEVSEDGGLLGNPIILAALALVVLALLGAGGFFLYKRRAAQAMPGEAMDFEGDDDFGELDSGFGEQGEEPELSDDFFGGDDEEEGSDLLTEATVYIAHERWDKAIENLKKLIDGGDESEEVKFKLLEAYAGSGDKQGFKALRADILTESPELESRIDEIGASLGAGQSSESMDMDATTRMDASDFDLDSNEEDFDISLDDLANDLDASFDGDKAEQNSSEENSASDLDALEDELELDSNAEETTSDSEELDLDLDLDDLSDDISSDDEATATRDPEDTVVLEPEDTKQETTGDNEDDDSLDLDLDDLNFDDEDTVSDNTAASDNSDELELDAELDLDIENDVPAQEKASGEEDALDLSGDNDELDLEFEDDLPAAETQDSSDDSDDDSFDLSDFDDSDADLDDDFSLDLDDDDDELDLGEDSDDSDLDLDLDTEDDASLESSEEDQPEPPATDTGEDKNVDSLFDNSEDDDFDLPEEGDEAATKLDLARAYIDMGDEEGAKDILEEVLSEGDDTQKAEAKDLMKKL